MLTPGLLASAALGSALGGMARVWVAERSGRWLGDRFPWGTLLVNLSGALLIGLLAGLWLTSTIHDAAGHTARAFLVTGILGSYTTVSSFSLQTLALWRERRPFAALLNIGLSLLGCLILIALGATAGHWLAGIHS